jgi:hypothetical protein
MLDDRDIGAQDLVISIFRMAVADALGIAYGHDGPAPTRRVRRTHSQEAQRFLTSGWAAYLADAAGFSGSAVRVRARDLYEAAEP